MRILLPLFLLFGLVACPHAKVKVRVVDRWGQNCMCGQGPMLMPLHCDHLGEKPVVIKMDDCEDEAINSKAVYNLKFNTLEVYKHAPGATTED